MVATMVTAVVTAIEAAVVAVVSVMTAIEAAMVVVVSVMASIVFAVMAAVAMVIAAKEAATAMVTAVTVTVASMAAMGRKLVCTVRRGGDGCTRSKHRSHVPSSTMATSITLVWRSIASRRRICGGRRRVVALLRRVRIGMAAAGDAVHEVGDEPLVLFHCRTWSDRERN
jgi:hypothetical protein